ncbi:hypothetical protein [Pedobacter heparinus]|nr:hypothetical protein [Pedobacter heparinus]
MMLSSQLYILFRTALAEANPLWSRHEPVMKLIWGTYPINGLQASKD